MTRFEITFVWPNEDWTWIFVDTTDFHRAILIALDQCPNGCRVQRIDRMPAKTTQEENNDATVS